MAGTSVPGLVGALAGMRDRPDSTALLGEIDRPVLVIHGADDQLIPPSEAEAMHRLLGPGKLKTRDRLDKGREKGRLKAGVCRKAMPPLHSDHLSCATHRRLQLLLKNISWG
jgi:hypothetical protein